MFSNPLLVVLNNLWQLWFLMLALQSAVKWYIADHLVHIRPGKSLVLRSHTHLNHRRLLGESAAMVHH